MSADVGFTPGKLIEAAQSIQPVADPFSQSMSTFGEEISSLCEGVNGPYVEPLGNALTKWNDSLRALYEDLGNLAEALVSVEELFGLCEENIIQAMIDAGSGFSVDDDNGSGITFYHTLQQLSVASDGGESE
jgi:hypothetical protein